MRRPLRCIAPRAKARPNIERSLNMTKERLINRLRAALLDHASQAEAIIPGYRASRFRQMVAADPVGATTRLICSRVPADGFMILIGHLECTVEFFIEHHWPIYASLFHPDVLSAARRRLSQYRLS